MNHTGGHYRRRMRARPTIMFAALVVASMVSAVSCSGATEPSPSTSTASSGGSAPGSTTGAGTALGAEPLIMAPVAPPTDPPGVHRFTTYWMRDCPAPEVATEIAGCRLAVGESRTTTAEDVARAAIDALMAGPQPGEADARLTSNIRKLSAVNSLVVEGDLATIDFNRYFETAKTRPQAAQVVYTLTQFPTIKRVQILVDRAPNGAIGANPLTRDDVDEFTPPILVESPTLNATVPHRFKATGLAGSADGVVHFRVETFDGAKYSEGSAPILGPPGEPGTIVLPITLPATLTGPVILLVYEAGTTGPATELTTPARILLVVA